MTTTKILFPREEIVDGKHFNVHQDWEVPIAGFFIVASKRKIKSISEFTDEELKEFINILYMVRKGMRDILGIEVVYIFQNEDTKDDFHLWLFPRHSWMKKFGIKVQSVRPVINYAKENMINDDAINKVKECAKKMKNYLEDFDSKL